MTSLQTHIAQPITRKFVNTQNFTDGEDGPTIYTKTDVDSWIAANAAKIRNLGGLLIIPGTSSGSTFVDVLKGNSGATELTSSYGTYNSRKALTDMGKQITIGSAADSDLLVLRLIKTPSNSQTGQSYIVGYIVEENNSADLDNNGGPFQVRVARV